MVILSLLKAYLEIYSVFILSLSLINLVDKSTVSRVITDVSRALIVKQPRFIKWPSTNDECATIKNAFYLRGGFPCVIGCVDGTHVRLQAPSLHENSYVNRKGFHSINVQGVCNHEGE